jgi:hypothetical protein
MVDVKNVRPFVTDELRLDDEEYGLDPEDGKVEAKIDQVLSENVRLLVDRARREAAPSSGDDAGPPPNRICKLLEPNLALVRIKVVLLTSTSNINVFVHARAFNRLLFYQWVRWIAWDSKPSTTSALVNGLSATWPTQETFSSSTK